MPSSTYNISKRNEEIARGRDQSFRNCIVTMLIFIMICIVIIAVSLPWRNTNLRYKHQKKEQLNDMEKDKSVGDNSERIITLKYRDTTVGSNEIEKNIETTRNTIFNRNIEPLWTTSRHYFHRFLTTARNTIPTSTEKVWGDSDNSLITIDNKHKLTTYHHKIDFLSTTARSNVKQPSTTLNKNDFTTRQNIFPFWTTVKNNFVTSSEKKNKIPLTINVDNSKLTTSRQNIVSLSTTNQNIEFTSRQNIFPFWTTVRNNFMTVSEKIEKNPEISSTIHNDNNKLTTLRENIVPLSTTIQNNNENIETSSSTAMYDSRFILESTNTETTSMTSLPQIEISTEIISSLPIDQIDMKYLSQSSEITTESSSKIETSSVSSSGSDELSVTPFNEFYYTDEIERSTAVYSTETPIDYLSTTDELITSNDVMPNYSENIEDIFNDEETSTTRNNFNFLKNLLIAIKYGNQSSTPDDSNLDWFNDYTTSNYQRNFNDNDKNKFLISSVTSEKNYADTTVKNFIPNENKITTISQISNDENQTETTMNIYTDINQIQTTSNILNKVIDNVLEENKTAIDITCLSGHCKQFSSRILSYMNHSADPCEDFYEYACGGMEADPQINNKNLEDEAVERIKNQLKKSKNFPQYSTFNDYYNSCIIYYQKTTQDDKIQRAKQMLKNIGKFYTPSNWPNDSYPEITKLIANMILHNSPPLFDIVPDINEINPDKFILRLSPFNNYQNPLQNFEINSCMQENDDDIQSDNIDMEKLYQSYKNCKNNKRQLSKSISKTLKIFGIFNYNYTFDEFEYVDKIIAVLSNYPNLNEIRAAYNSKNYSIITLGVLQNQSNIINWIDLIHILTGVKPTSDTKLQIYFPTQLIYTLNELKNFHQLYELNNALLGLYAQNLYEQFIKPKTFGDIEKHCMYNTVNYLPAEASNLYLSSFTKMELNFINSTMYKVFFNLKETLKLKIVDTQWTTETDRYKLLEKIDKIQMSIPNNLNIKNISNIKMSVDFINNTAILMKKFRKNMYRIMIETPNNPEQLWTYFAKPFQSHGQVIYSLNIILIPFGAFNSPNILENDENFIYLTFATIGNLIAREIAHHFDTNGNLYWNGTRNFAFTYFNNTATQEIYDDYVNCHKNFLFHESINIKLPTFNKQINVKVPQSTLNERLSDVMGIRLAHDTLARMESTSLKLLPWLDLDIYKLFYLTYTQTYCTKAPLMSSYFSLYENSIMPSRLRIFIIAINNKMLGKLWKCREGSPILPIATCDIFPYLQYSYFQNPPITNM